MSCELKTVEFWKLGKKIIGAGLNYKCMIKEKNVPVPSEPLIFSKASSSYIVEGQPIVIPKGYNVDAEVELGVIISKNCKRIKPTEVMDYVAGYCVALDLTATNIISEAQSKGTPWIFGKGFDTACPVGGFIPREKIQNPANIKLWSSVNGKLRQDGNTSDMVFSVGDIISYVSQHITLEQYDLIVTGTPRGVGPIFPGDVVEAGFKDIAQVKFSVKSA